MNNAEIWLTRVGLGREEARKEGNMDFDDVLKGYILGMNLRPHDYLP